MKAFVLCLLPVRLAVASFASGDEVEGRLEHTTCSTVGPLIAPARTHTGRLPWIAPVAGNSSYMLGWQLSGLFGTKPQLQPVCGNFSKVAAKVAKTGLDIEAIKLPLCNRANCDTHTDLSGILANLTSYSSNLFQVQLVASVVNKPENWLTLCNTINPLIADIFFGAGNKIVASVCHQVRHDLAPTPDYGTNSLLSTTAETIRTSATLLLVWQTLPFAQEPSELKGFCDTFVNKNWNILPSVSALNLNSTLFANTFCSYIRKPLPSIGEIREKYDQYTHEIFAETLWSLGNSEQFRKFICEGHEIDELKNIVTRQYFSRASNNTVDRKLIEHCKLGF